MVDDEQGLGRGSEAPAGSVPIPTERGSRRFPWKSSLMLVGLMGVSVVAGEAVFGVFDTTKPIAGLGARSLGLGAAVAAGFALSTVLACGFNIFREDVNYLFGNGQLHPKSPSLLRRIG